MNLVEFRNKLALASYDIALNCIEYIEHNIELTTNASEEYKKGFNDAIKIIKEIIADSKKEINKNLKGGN